MKRWGILMAIAVSALACNDRYDERPAETTTTPPPSMSTDTTTPRSGAVTGDSTMLRDTIRR